MAQMFDNIYNDHEYEQNARDEYAWEILMDMRLELTDLCDRMLKRKAITTVVKNSTREEREAIETVRRMIARLEQEPIDA